MKNFETCYLKPQTEKEIINKLKNIFEDNAHILLLIGEENKPDIQKLMQLALDSGLKICGGIFPGLILGDSKYMEGIIAVRLPKEANPKLIQDLSNLDASHFEKLMKPLKTSCASMIIVDAFSTSVEPFLKNLNDTFGPLFDFIGAGAGHLTLKQEPCLFYDNQFVQDAALLIPLAKHHLSLGIKHGWKRLSGPYVATHTEKKRIYELNWNNAADFYIPELEKLENIKITPDNFYDVCKSYPFGLFKDGFEDIVRDPISFKSGEYIECVSEVPENASLYLLKGTTSSLIDAAMKATDAATLGVSGTIEGLFIVDCISRVLKLGNEFEKEIHQVTTSINNNKINCPVFGVLSIGEIATYAYSQTELFNKTIVIGAFHDEST